MAALARPNALTLVAADTSLAKRITVVDGVVTRTDDPPGRHRRVRDRRGHQPRRSARRAQQRRNGNPAPCVVRADPLTDLGAARSTMTPRRGRPACASCRAPGSATTSRRCRPAASTRCTSPSAPSPRPAAACRPRTMMPPSSGRSPRAPASAATSCACACGSCSTARCSAARSSVVQARHRFRLARPGHASQRSHTALHRRHDRRQQPGPLPATLGPDPRRARRRAGARQRAGPAAATEA